MLLRYDLTFSPARRYATSVLAVIVGPSVRLSVMQTTPRDSAGTLSFLTPTVVGGRGPITPEICAQSDPPTPFEHNDFELFD